VHRLIASVTVVVVVVIIVITVVVVTDFNTNFKYFEQNCIINLCIGNY